MKTKETKTQVVQRIALEHAQHNVYKAINESQVLKVGDKYANTTTGASHEIINFEKGIAFCKSISKCTKNTSIYNFRIKVGEIHSESMEQLFKSFYSGYIYKI